MKMNEIKYLPKSNAVADVYSKATGMPFVGEMMAAAAGNGGKDEKTVWYVAYGDKDGTVETSRGTGELTGVIEDVDDGYQEGILLTNNNYPQLVGQHIWFSKDAAVDDGNVWQIFTKNGNEFVPFGVYGSFFSEEPEAPKQDAR